MPSARRHLDVTGTFCPLPILLAAREMRKLRAGDLLELVGDDPGIREDLQVWCERTGHRLLELSAEGETIRALVEKGEKKQREAKDGKDSKDSKDEDALD